MRNDHNATELHLRWAAVLGDWMVCNPTDRGAVKFARVEPAVAAEPTKRYWAVTLSAKLGKGPMDQYGMLTASVYAATVEEAERIALEQENVEPLTELKVQFTRPS